MISTSSRVKLQSLLIALFLLMLQFCGGRALSPFRLEKLIKQINMLGLPVARLTAEYWHFCAITQDLQGAELSALRQLLNHDEALENIHHPGELF